MSTLAEHRLHYEDLPQKHKFKRNPIKGGKDSKMSKSTNESPKVSKKYAKTRGEHFKDIVIAILVTAIIAFIAGMSFQNKQQGAIDTAVKAVTPTASAEEPVKK